MLPRGSTYIWVVAMSKSFLRGAGSVIDLLPSSRKAKVFIPNHSDEEAIYKDWETVGNDLFVASKKVSSKKPVKSKNNALKRNKPR